jgi:hypothetical protein
VLTFTGGRLSKIEKVRQNWIYLTLNWSASEKKGKK